MSSNFNSQSTNTVNDNTNYINSERSETSPLYSSSKDTGNLNFIITFFSVFSAAVAAALAIQIKYGNHQITPHGSVASDSEECSMIGESVLMKGGNAVDAAVATTFCIGVIRPHLTGVGGGGVMLIYDHRDGKVLDSIDFRVTKSLDPGVGVPGFLAGLALAHQLHGVLPWKTVLAPSIQIAKNGFKVTSGLVKAKEEHYIQNSHHNVELNGWLENVSEGAIVKMPKLALLLESVAKLGASVFYNQTLKMNTLELNPDDFASYQPTRGTPLKGSLMGYNIITSGAGTGGATLLQALPNLNISSSSIISFAGAFQSDTAALWPIPSGSHVAVADVNDLYVSIVSGLGSVLGSQLLTPSEYILNNALEIISDDVSSRTKRGEKVPTLSVPIIAVQSSHICARRLILGSSDVRDGAQALLSLLNGGEDEKSVKSSVEATRVRFVGPHILEETEHTPVLPLKERNALRRANYALIPAPLPYPSINVIQKVNDATVAYADSRGYGQAIAF